MFRSLKPLRIERITGEEGDILRSRKIMPSSRANPAGIKDTGNSTLVALHLSKPILTPSLPLFPHSVSIPAPFPSPVSPSPKTFPLPRPKDLSSHTYTRNMASAKYRLESFRP